MPEQEERLVFESGAVPRRRKTQGRPLSVRCCLIFLAVIGTVFSLLILVFIAKVARGAYHNITSPFSEFAHDPIKGSEDAAHTIVKPLINSSSYFDVRATVWLDVTHHLNQSNSLPSDIKVVHYKQPNGQQRSEAILYSDLLFTNATMQSRLHSLNRIRIPVEPMYSQPLGPATLRATFQLVPHEVPAGLYYKASGSIYPTFLPIGPRSPQSVLLKENQSEDGHLSPASLDEALERSGINVNLLNLLPSKWRLNDTNYNLRDDHHVDPPIFDGSSANRAFAANTSSTDPLVGEKHRIMLPHVRTRSRIILLNEDRNFSVTAFVPRLTAAKETLETACAGMRNSSASRVSDGRCQRPGKDAIFEKLLHFSSKEDEAQSGNASFAYFYYAPYLTQQRASSAYRHHRTLPRSLPSSTTPPLSQVDSKDGCLVPMLETDDSQKFFEFDWDVFFSAHHHLRATAAESTSLSVNAALEDYRDNGTQIRIRMNTGHEMQWSMSGLGFADQEHPKSKPWSLAWQIGFTFIGDGFIALLNILYWYTRSTSQGLSWRALWLSIGASGMGLIGEMAAMADGDWSAFQFLVKPLFLSFTAIPLFLQIAVLFRLDVGLHGISRRPTTKKERLSRRLDDEIGWRLPLAVLVLHFFFATFLKPTDTYIVSAKGCFAPPDAEESLTPLMQAFKRLIATIPSTVGITQLYFNHKSNSFAGNFKISAFTIFTFWACFLAIEHSEKIGGWQANRGPVYVGDVVLGLIRIAFVYQAITLPGISQVLSEDEDDL